MKHLLVFFSIAAMLCGLSAAQGQTLTAVSASAIAVDTVLATSFEATGSPSFTPGTVNGQNLWSVSSGTADVVTDAAYAKEGSAGLKFTTSTSLLVNYTPYTGYVSGAGDTLYFDLYVKILASTGKEFTINGDDNWGSSAKRSFVVDFTVPVSGAGSVRIYNGSSKVTAGSYTAGSWVRISGRVNYADSSYQVSIDGGVPMSALFREPYSVKGGYGTRPAITKEFHRLRFNLGADTNTGTVDAAVDRLYIGSTPIPDITFGSTTVTYKVTVNQPAVGKIALSPSGPTFESGTSVTATLTHPIGYKNYGWTDDVSGTGDTVRFTVKGAMTIGASVGIDSVSPPPMLALHVTQPKYGTITLSPQAVAPDSFYASTRITATLRIPTGYRNNGWTGALSGTALSGTFTIMTDTVLSADVLPPPDGTRKTFASASTFKAGLLQAVPGDTIELADGVYDIGLISPDSAAVRGTEAKRILIRAANRGKAELAGTSAFDFKFSEYVTVEGFYFTSNPGTVIRTECSNNMRITRNHFRLSETMSGKWVLIGGYYRQPLVMSHHNRIDHNLFEEKHQIGNCITLDGSPVDLGAPQISQYDRIDHNHFRNVGPRAVNEMETLRMGVSGLTASSAFDTVEYNLFEQCDGDPEVISVKSCDNTIRYNTILRSKGTVCLRSTQRTVVYGNFFLGEGRDSTGGVRVYGSGHKIYNNYFEGLRGSTWDAAITITNGDVELGGSQTAHWRPTDITVIFNTFVDNKATFEFGYTSGGSYTKPPQGLVIANNVAAGSMNPLVKYFTAPASVTYEGNIMNPTGTSSLGITAAQNEIRVADPLFEQHDSLWCLSASSPAIDASLGSYGDVLEDVQGQTRIGVKDAGADERSDAPALRRPLTAADVGPDAIEQQTVTGVPMQTHAAQPESYFLLSNYPNPFNPSTTLGFTVPQNGTATLTVYNELGGRVAVLFQGPVRAGELNRVTFEASRRASGVYYAVLRAGGRSTVRRMMLLK